MRLALVDHLKPQRPYKLQANEYKVGNTLSRSHSQLGHLNNLTISKNKVTGLIKKGK